MEINEANYIGSFPNENKCPKDKRPEYAFIGRSNVGKSSLINMLTGRKDLAKVSKSPGKTQMINYFLINESWYLVDLPGYGYAKRSKKKRYEWEKMISIYLEKRVNLQCAIVLIDSNIEPQSIDIEFINWLGEKAIPFVIAFTKSDKLGKTKIQSNIKRFEDEMHKYWNELPRWFLTSSSELVGKEPFLSFIEEINLAFHKNWKS